jgi:hypothetical protein
LLRRAVVNDPEIRSIQSRQNISILIGGHGFQPDKVRFHGDRIIRRLLLASLLLILRRLSRRLRRRRRGLLRRLDRAVVLLRECCPAVRRNSERECKNGRNGRAHPQIAYH